METLTAVSLEWALFIGCIAIMLKTKDAQILFQSHQSNLILTLPAAALLLPMLFGFPWGIPPELIIPHLTYLAIFTISILKDLIPS